MIIKEKFKRLDEEIKVLIEIFLWAVIFVFGLSFGFYFVKGMDFYEKVIVEAHGMVLDILVSVLSFFTYTEKRINAWKQNDIRRRLKILETGNSRKLLIESLET